MLDNENFRFDNELFSKKSIFFQARLLCQRKFFLSLFIKKFFPLLRLENCKVAENISWNFSQSPERDEWIAISARRNLVHEKCFCGRNETLSQLNKHFLAYADNYFGRAEFALVNVIKMPNAIFSQLQLHFETLAINMNVYATKFLTAVLVAGSFKWNKKVSQPNENLITRNLFCALIGLAYRSERRVKLMTSHQVLSGNGLVTFNWCLWGRWWRARNSFSLHNIRSLGFNFLNTIKPNFVHSRFQVHLGVAFHTFTALTSCTKGFFARSQNKHRQIYAQRVEAFFNKSWNWRLETLIAHLLTINHRGWQIINLGRIPSRCDPMWRIIANTKSFVWCLCNTSLVWKQFLIQLVWKWNPVHNSVVTWSYSAHTECTRFYLLSIWKQP